MYTCLKFITEFWCRYMREPNDQYVFHNVCHSVPMSPAVLVHSLHFTCQQVHIFKYTLFYHLFPVPNLILVQGWGNPMTNMLFIAGPSSCQQASYTLDTLPFLWIQTETLSYFRDTFCGNIFGTLVFYQPASYRLDTLSPLWIRTEILSCFTDMSAYIPFGCSDRSSSCYHLSLQVLAIFRQP